MGANCGGSGSEAVNDGSFGCGWRLFKSTAKRDLPCLFALLIGRRRTTLPVFSAPAKEVTKRIPNAIAYRESRYYKE